MSKTTANFGLIKPELTDSADITQMNQNWDTIDAQLKTVDDRVTTVDNKFKNYATTKDVDDAIEQINEQLDGLSTDAGNLTGVLPISHGGTGATTVAKAQSALGIVPMNDIPSLHIWEKYSGDPSNYSLSDITNTKLGMFVQGKTSLYYSDEIEIVNGRIHLTNAVRLSGSTADTFNVIKDKYVCAVPNTESVPVYYVPSSATLTCGSNGLFTTLSQQVIFSEFVGYVASKTDTTYPANGKHTDGYWYVYSKQLCEPDYTYGTADLTPGTSALETGKLYFVYE